MGLLKGGINEIIATTSDNAAPIGIHYRDHTARMILFLGTHTAENIERDGWVVANFVYDPMLYVQTAFEDLPHDAFVEEPVAGKTMHRLRAAEAWCAFSATVEHKSQERLIVQLKPEREIMEGAFIHPVNRGFNSIIDATVHATRYVMNTDPQLKMLIDYHAGIVRKCGGKREIEALDLLLKYMG
ncbi:MAG: DUF447 domain-containing protein [Methanoregula sp.]|nr:DUF447 family protein [Methanoregula sp.]